MSGDAVQSRGCRRDVMPLVAVVLPGCNTAVS